MDRELAIKTLDRYFDALKSQDKDWGFFMGLADYVNLLDEIPQIKRITDRMKEPKQGMLKKIWDVEELAIKELQILSKEVIKRSKKVQTEEVAAAVVALKKNDKGEVNSGWWHSARLEHGIRDLVKAMSDAGAGAQLDDLIPQKARSGGYLSLYELCPAFNLRSALSYGLSEQKETELWGNYEKIQLAAKIFQQGNQLRRDLEKDKDSEKTLKYLAERELIRTGDDDHRSGYMLASDIYGTGKTKKFSSSSDHRINEFKRDRYQNYITRLHNHFTKELSKDTLAHQSSKDLSFDPEKSRLHVKGNEVRIRKFSDQYHALRVIFADPAQTPKEWFFSELVELIDEKNKNEKRYYNAAYQVRAKLNGKGLPNFFITTKQSLKISPEYLS